MAMQYGGWYDNPATGKNQRWWNGVWTDGAEPGKSSSSNSSSGSSNNSGSSSKSVKFDIPNYQEYYNKANQSLTAYYERVLAEEQGDVERAKRRLEEDYKKGMRITTEDYVKSNTRATEDVSVARTQNQAAETQENRQLEGNLVSRGVSQGGVAATLTGEQTDRQKLRREAIDRALTRTQEDLKYGKERGQEDLTINQRRGTEDVASAYSKFVTQQQQEKQDKALALGDQSYQRDLQAKQIKANFASLGA